MNYKLYSIIIYKLYKSNIFYFLKLSENNLIENI